VHIPICNRTIENLTGDTGKDLAECHTHPVLARFLLLRLLEWKTRTPRKALRMMEHDLQESQDAQDDIGWEKFMCGNIMMFI
jgi:hypothetical protein